MATGNEMMLKALRGLIPDHIWQAVEKNLLTIGEKAAALEALSRENNARMARIEDTQFRILQLLGENGYEQTSATNGSGGLRAIAGGGDSSCRS